MKVAPEISDRNVQKTDAAATPVGDIAALLNEKIVKLEIICNYVKSSLYLPISPFLHRAIALQYAATGI